MKTTKILIVGAAVAIFSNPVARASEPDLELRQNCRTVLPQDQNQEPVTKKHEAEPKLSDSLAECSGVLRPPSVGDDMAVPPPENDAKTPVLPPGSIPEQAPKG